jgi:hypothetical protein
MFSYNLETTPNKFFNLAELSTVVLEQILSEIVRKKENLNYVFPIKHLTSCKIATGFLVDTNQLEEVINKTKLEIVIDLKDNNKSFIILDRFVLTENNISKLDQAKKIGTELNIELGFLAERLPTEILEQKNKLYLVKEINNNKWRYLIVEEVFDLSENLHNHLSDIIENFDCNLILDKFLNPSRYYKFCALIKNNFNICCTYNDTLVEYLESIYDYIPENKILNSLLNLIKIVSYDCDIKLNTNIFELPIIIQNSLILIRATLSSDIETLKSFQEYCLPEIAKNLNYQNKVEIVSLSEKKRLIKLNYIPDNQHVIQVENKFSVSSSLLVALNIKQELKIFFNRSNVNIYKSKTIEEYLELNITDFFKEFGNHPKWRRISTVWNTMNMPNISLDYELVNLGYETKFLIYIALQAAKLREDSIFLIPSTLYGICEKSVDHHLLPLLEWLDKLKIKVLFANE